MGRYLFVALSIFIMACSNSLPPIEGIPIWENRSVPFGELFTASEKNYDYEGKHFIENVSVPSLEIFLAPDSRSTGKCVVICPGGGYKFLAYDWEGSTIAKVFAARGISAFVLKYRLPNQHMKVPLIDLQRAVKYVRHNSDQWNIFSDQIGVLGFSAGGHLASSLNSHYGDTLYTFEDDIDLTDPIPNFMCLMYPVISMKDGVTHEGSRFELLGPTPDESSIRYFSNELHINSSTPPTFIIHAKDDEVVPIRNSQVYMEALQKNNVKAQFVAYETGNHGFSLGLGNNEISGWPEEMIQWILNLEPNSAD